MENSVHFDQNVHENESVDLELDRTAENEK